MTAPVNTQTTLTTIGIREDLENAIYLVAPEDTPVISTIDKTPAKSFKHDWQTDNLATPNPNNANYEGDDVTTFDAPNQTVRVENYMQIFRKTVSVSRTDDVVVKAGRAKESARQVLIKMKELKRDMEARMAGNYASSAETAGTTPRQTGGMLACISTNSFSGTGGAAGGYNGSVVTAATNGTQRNLTETMFKAGMASVFASGGKPTVALMGGTLKQEFSAFTGIAEIRVDAGPKMARIVGAADVYQSDFGKISLVPHPYAFSRDLVCIDPSMWAVGVLDGTKISPLAKTGDSTKQLMTNESGLIYRNERSSFALRDLL
ncbi:MAG: SU10 major capsid protein [Caulobacteraceae bacterium]